MADGNSTVSYKSVPGFPGYRVGDDGSVWIAWRVSMKGRQLTDRWKPMKLSPNSRGYIRVNLTQPEGGRYQTFRVHRLVLECFVGPCPGGMECRHLNGVKTDNRLCNLVWGTAKENYADNHRLRAYSGKPRNRMFTYQGETLSMKEWSVRLNIPYPCLNHRINKIGMSFDAAVSTPFLGLSGNGKVRLATRPRT